MKMHRSARFTELLRHLAEASEEDARRIFKERTGYTKGRVTQFETEGFGERAGISIAKRLGLPDERWSERPIGTPINAKPNPTPPTTASDVIRLGAKSPVWPFTCSREQFDQLPADRKREIDEYMKERVLLSANRDNTDGENSAGNE